MGPKAGLDGRQISSPPGFDPGPCRINSSIKNVKVKVKRSRYRPGVAQRVGRGIALLFHDRGTRSG